MNRDVHHHMPETAQPQLRNADEASDGLRVECRRVVNCVQPGVGEKRHQFVNGGGDAHSAMGRLSPQRREMLTHLDESTGP